MEVNNQRARRSGECIGFRFNSIIYYCSCMKHAGTSASSTKKVRTSTKTIWSADEDHAVLSILAEVGSPRWREIATILKRRCGTGKSPKQCRERYRNYLNPTYSITEWGLNEKTLFIVLHKVLGNKWSQMTQYMEKRSDIAIKNHFYCLIRKTLKRFAALTIPDTLVREPTKVLAICHVLGLLRYQYLPLLRRDSPSSKRMPKEKFILTLLQERSITAAALQLFEDQLIVRFKESHPAAILPLTLSVEVSPATAVMLAPHQELYNNPSMAALIKVEVHTRLQEPPRATPKLSFPTNWPALPFVGLIQPSVQFPPAPIPPSPALATQRTHWQFFGFPGCPVACLANLPPCPLTFLRAPEAHRPPYHLGINPIMQP
jgi:hypothetical protein